MDVVTSPFVDRTVRSIVPAELIMRRKSLRQVHNNPWFESECHAIYQSDLTCECAVVDVVELGSSGHSECLTRPTSPALYLPTYDNTEH